MSLICLECTVLPMGAMKVLASPYLELTEDNPFQSLLYTAMEKHNVYVSAFSTRKLMRESCDIWHLHWPEHIINNRNSREAAGSLLKFWIKLKLARLKGTKIFWNVHNINPHERSYPFFEKTLWHILLSNVDGIICMSEISRQQLFSQRSRARSIPTFVIPHGHYRGAYPDVIDKNEARETLGIRSDEFVLTFLGQIRPYKGLVSLIHCFTAAQITNAKLLVAGKPFNNDALANVSAAAAFNSNVQLFPYFVGRNDIQKFLRAADLVVFPYIDILNSGSALLALSFDRPILVPAKGSFTELQETIGSDWIHLYSGELSAEIISEAVCWAKDRGIDQNIRPPLEGLNWNRIAELTIQAFSLNGPFNNSAAYNMI